MQNMKARIGPDCDMKFHSKAPFHRRLLKRSFSGSITAKKCLPTETVDTPSYAFRVIGRRIKKSHTVDYFDFQSVLSFGI